MDERRERPNISERLLRLPGGRKRMLAVLLEPANAGLGPEAVCKLARVARSTYWQARRDPKFLSLVHDIKAALFPRWKERLIQRSLADALVSLQEAKSPAALVEIREQVARFLALPTKPEHVGLRPGQTAFYWWRYPDAVRAEWSRTGRWDRERWGPPPWELG